MTLTYECIFNLKVEKLEDGAASLKKQTRLGLEAKKEENLSDWYSQVIHLLFNVLLIHNIVLLLVEYAGGRDPVGCVL